MRCPIHADTALETRTVEPGVAVRACPHCGGYWMDDGRVVLAVA